MTICASCGQTTPREARFCFACGAGLDGVALFDLKGNVVSTARARAALEHVR